MVEFRVLAVVGMLVVSIVTTASMIAAFAVVERLRLVWERMREHRMAIGRQRC